MLPVADDAPGDFPQRRAQAVGDGQRAHARDARAGEEATARVVGALEGGFGAEDEGGCGVQGDGYSGEHAAAAAGGDDGVEVVGWWGLGVVVVYVDVGCRCVFFSATLNTE